MADDTKKKEPAQKIELSNAKFKLFQQAFKHRKEQRDKNKEKRKLEDK